MSRRLGAIRQMGPDARKAVSALRPLLESTNPRHHLNVWLALASIGGDGIDVLLDAVESKKGLERGRPIMAIARAPYLQSSQRKHIARWLHESHDLPTRVAAADVVLAHDTSSAEPATVYRAVLESSNATELYVRHAMAQLGAMGPKAAAAINDVVLKISTTDSREVKGAGLDALRAMEPATTRVLCSTLESSTSSREIQNRAVLLHALARPIEGSAERFEQDSSATKALLRHIGSDDAVVRLSVCQALLRVAEPSEALRGALRKRVEAGKADALLALAVLSRATDNQGADVRRGLALLRSRDHELERVAFVVAGFGQPGIIAAGLELQSAKDNESKAYWLEVLASVISINKQEAVSAFDLVVPYLAHVEELVRSAAASSFRQGVLPSTEAFDALLDVVRAADAAKRSAAIHALSNVLIFSSEALDRSPSPALVRQRVQVLPSILSRIEQRREWLSTLARPNEQNVAPDAVLVAQLWLARIGEAQPPQGRVARRCASPLASHRRRHGRSLAAQGRPRCLRAPRTRTLSEGKAPIRARARATPARRREAGSCRCRDNVQFVEHASYTSRHAVCSQGHRPTSRAAPSAIRGRSSWRRGTSICLHADPG